MTQPYRGFSASQTLVQLLTASKLSTADIGTLYNLAYREIVESHQWFARKAENIVNTVAPYSTGTIATTQGSTTVTGTSTVWTSAMTDRYIRINDEDTLFKFTFVSATSGTLEKAWAFAAVSGASYEIFQYVYVIDSTNGQVGSVLTPAEGWPLVEKSFEWLQLRDPARRATGSTPVAWIGHGYDANGAYQMEFWPRYSTATSIRIPYYKRVDDLSSTTQPIIRSDVIEARTISYCADHLYAKFGDKHWIDLGERYDKKFEELLEDALREDVDRHNLPRQVQEELRGYVGGDFVALHDV